MCDNRSLPFSFCSIMLIIFSICILHSIIYFFSLFLFISETSIIFGRARIYPTFPREDINSSLTLSYSPRAISTVANHERIYAPSCEHNSCRVGLNRYAADAGRSFVPNLYWARISFSNFKSSNSCIPWYVVSCSIEFRLFHNECVAVISLSHNV